VRGPIAELQAFVHAALVEPVPRDHTESAARFRRRRIVAVITLVIGAGVLGWALRIEPGDDLFYLATVALAIVWLVGAFASGQLHLGHTVTRSGEHARPIVQPIVLGVVLLAIFCAGALVVGRIPVLREPVQDLLDHARYGSLPIVALITALNGISEELYFRGALYAGVGRRHAVLVTTIVYALVTAASGIPLLVFAAAILGVVVGLQRRVTGGILGPIITHLIWSLGMLFLLPPLFAWAS
jgi:membrane protease YdiL (CAAX protease family)